MCHCANSVQLFYLQTPRMLSQTQLCWIDMQSVTYHGPVVRFTSADISAPQDRTVWQDGQFDWLFFGPATLAPSWWRAAYKFSCHVPIWWLGRRIMHLNDSNLPKRNTGNWVFVAAAVFVVAAELRSVLVLEAAALLLFPSLTSLLFRYTSSQPKWI